MGQVATISIGANSYSVYALTTNALADANKYFAAHINAAEWEAAETNDRKKALVTAFRGIERELWTGEAQGATAWPRTGATKNGDAVPDGTPDDIALGEFELALSLLKDNTTLDKRSTRTDIRSVGAGSAQVSFFMPPPGEETRFPVVANDYLSPYLASSSSGTSVPFVSGTDVESSFSADDFTRNEGFA